jgi:hypothetical protein
MPGRYACVHRVARRDGGNGIFWVVVASEHGAVCRGWEAMVARSSLACGGSSLVQSSGRSIMVALARAEARRRVGVVVVRTRPGRPRGTCERRPQSPDRFRRCTCSGPHKEDEHRMMIDCCYYTVYSVPQSLDRFRRCTCSGPHKEDEHRMMIDCCYYTVYSVLLLLRALSFSCFALLKLFANPSA